MQQPPPRARPTTTTLDDARDKLTNFARRFANAAREHWTEHTTPSTTTTPGDDETPDPLEEDRRDLIARFEELERRSKKD